MNVWGVGGGGLSRGDFGRVQKGQGGGGGEGEVERFGTEEYVHGVRGLIGVTACLYLFTVVPFRSHTRCDQLKFGHDNPTNNPRKSTDVIHAKGVIKTMLTNSLGILGARANAECLEDRLGDGKAAFGRRRSADAANREAYDEYSRHCCSGDGGHAGGRSRT